MTNHSNRILITVAVMTATVMQVLDTTIINVALPHMQSEVSATPSQISWVVTSYLLAIGIFMPLTGYFSDRYGQKSFLYVTILCFTISSILCGLSVNLREILLFRFIQGASGAALVPLSQAILVTTFPASERGKATAIWGIGVMVAPILGPTIGGWLTETLSWRWNFFINLPFGIISAFLTIRYVPDTTKHIRQLDWVGLCYLVLAVAGLQYLLDRGPQNDWFSSDSIRLSGLLSIIGIVGLILHISRSREVKLFTLEILSDRNFASSSILMALIGFGIFGSLLLQPLMLEGLMHYPTTTVGLLLAPRGIASMFSMIVVAKLMKHLNSQTLIVFGVIIFSIGSYQTTQYSLEIGVYEIIVPMIYQGFGIGLVFVPISTLAFSTLDPRYSAEASGLLSLSRAIGTSFGVSMVMTVLTRHSQIAWQTLGQIITPYNPAISNYFNRLNMTIQSPESISIIAMEIKKQSEMIGFLRAYQFVAVIFLFILPFVFLLKNDSQKANENIE